MNTNKILEEIIPEYMKNSGSMSHDEINHLLKTGQRCLPGTVVVWGLGYDFDFWLALNEGGETHFIEHNKEWIDKFADRVTDKVKIHKVEYTCTLGKLYAEMQNVQLLSIFDYLNLLPNIDIQFVDSPEGGDLPQHGRLQSIYTASKLMCRHTLVHDCNRNAERILTRVYLGERFRQIDKIRHYELSF